MVRYRRYRVFLVFTIFAIAALYRFTTVQEWEAATTASVERLKEYAGQSYKDKVVEDSESVQSESNVGETKTSPTHLADKVEAALPKVTAKPIGDWELGEKGAPIKKVIDKITPLSATSTSAPPGRSFGLSGQGRHDAPPPLTDVPVIHWERLPEHFPVPKDRRILLPTGTPLSIPKIQHDFKVETGAEKADREKKQVQIKAAFQHSWKGYKERAWLHDELQPISGESRDTFCGWGATLVDALDTLWIMGLKSDFNSAVKALEKIDFTTTTRGDIPMFETTIRYLGGLLAAHDVSGGKEKIILTKAKELGDILLSAFDTPNRMPITYYNWRPTFAKNPHRAGTRTVLAELGSLSMEFTRLAQLTKEDKYYDAVARITNELEIMQSKTRLPGLWPEKIDTSGCQKPPSPSPQEAIHQQGVADQARIAGTKKPIIKLDGASDTPKPETAKSEQIQKRQLNTDEAEVNAIPKGLNTGPPGPPEPPKAETDKTPAVSPAAEKDTVPDKSPVQNKDTVPASNAPTGDADQVAPSEKAVKTTPREKVDCLAQGLTSPPHSFSETFKFGGSADSTYEYLPKMYLLTGGLVPQYRRMYEKAIKAANEYLLFRPMIPESNREILVVGSAEVREGWPEYPEGNFTLTPSQSHLLCFTGGMYGIGSKLFNREADFDVAKKITDGCVWSYESTATGIMPESMKMIACPSRTECAWNETLWKEIVDPFWKQREEQRLLTQKAMEDWKVQQAAEDSVAASGDLSAFNVKKASDQNPGLDTVQQSTEGPLAKRAIDTELTSNSTIAETSTSSSSAAAETSSYNPYPSHEEYVEQQVSEGRIFKGVPQISGHHYILRPEAIESVFIMYRMTGDDYWRQKGWTMWEAIERETKAKYGHSAIKDVMSKNWDDNQNNEMESFWLAETLKYFYLLFSTPDTLSLDDWVLNTEAHPFKRPK